jgi:hypothetical protein
MMAWCCEQNTCQMLTRRCDFGIIIAENLTEFCRSARGRERDEQVVTE